MPDRPDLTDAALTEARTLTEQEVRDVAECALQYADDLYDLASRVSTGPADWVDRESDAAKLAEIRGLLILFVLALADEVRRLREALERAEGDGSTLYSALFALGITRGRINAREAWWWNDRNGDEPVCTTAEEAADAMWSEYQAVIRDCHEAQEELHTARAELARVSGMLHEVETRCDRAGEVRERVCASETARALWLENEELRRRG